MSRNKYLLGVSKYNELVFGEFEVTERNGYPEFTASFYTVFPITEDDVDAEDYYENLVEEMDDSWVLEQLKFYDCPYSELVDKLARDNGTEVYNIRDCSMYSEEIDVGGTTYYFESSACGQHDTRKEGMKLYTNQKAYDKLHELWDKYHLKEVDEEVIKEVQELYEALSEIEEKEWIENWIREGGY